MNMPMHTLACTHTMFSYVYVIHIQLNMICKCIHTEGREPVCNWVKPERTDHCCAITFLQKRTEKSKRKGKRKGGLCQVTHPRGPAKGLCSIRPHSYYSKIALGWNTNILAQSLCRPQSVLMGVNISLRQHDV